MPELPDIMLYLHCLTPRVVGQPIERVTITSPFVLRTVDPPCDTLEGKTVRELRRLGKRVVFRLDDDLFFVVHLMIAGRFRWFETEPSGKKPSRRLKIAQAFFEFERGTLVLTEAASRKRASIHIVRGEAALAEHRRDGLEVMEIDLNAFAERLRVENHTLKRSLTDPRLFSGIGNAYSDEILHRARLSPVKLSQRLSDAEIERLHVATRATLQEWIERLRDQHGGGFPGSGDVTAFRPEMAVHGRFGQPCPDCGAKVQRIVYATNETNYCPGCQTEGRVLADRSLSRLLKKDWAAFAEGIDREA